MSSQKHAREEHERRRVAGKTVEETRCARLSPLAFLSPSFFCRRKARKRETFDDIIFFSLLLFFSTNDPKTHVACHLSLFICEVDESLRRLARLSGVDFSPEIADAVIELCRANVSPVAIVSVLKSLAGRRREEHNSAMSSPL